MTEIKSEKEIAQQIKKIWKVWPDIKRREGILLDKITLAWQKKEEKPTEKTEYSG